jgi:hypothetical protein
MCQYTVTEYACGHDLIHDVARCETKLTAGPYEHFPQCEYTEVVRYAPGSCGKCVAKFQEHRNFARKNASSSWKRKFASTKHRIFAPLVKIVEEFGDDGRSHEAYGPQTPVTTQPAQKLVTAKQHGKPAVATTKAAEQPENSAASLWSWSVDDDLPWQQEASPIEEAISPLSPRSKPRWGSPVSPLDTLPSQEHILRHKAGSIDRQRRASRPHIESGIGPSHLGGHNGWKVNAPTTSTKTQPTEALGSHPPTIISEQKGKEPSNRQPLQVSTASLWNGVQTPVVSPPTALSTSATTTKRRSRADQQAAELFLDAAPSASSPSSPKHRSLEEMPSLLIPGKRDSTFKAQSVGQVPAHYDTTLLKSCNRKAKLTAEEEADWDKYLGWAGPSFQNASTQTTKMVEKVETTQSEKVGTKGKDTIRMSSRISRPGLHDFYTPNKALAISAELLTTAPITMMSKGEMSSSKQSRGQVPMLQVRSEPESEWDRVVMKAMVSIDSLNR